jgi:hypothetical protein
MEVIKYWGIREMMLRGKFARRGGQCGEMRGQLNQSLDRSAQTEKDHALRYSTTEGSP